MADPRIADLLARAAELGVTDEAVARALIKANKVRSYKRLGDVIAAMKPKGKALRVRKSNVIHNEGPRGFKFGPVWLNSIRAQKGIALSPSNLPKLRRTAEKYGVDSSLEQEVMVAELAKIV